MDNLNTISAEEMTEKVLACPELMKVITDKSAYYNNAMNLAMNTDSGSIVPAIKEVAAEYSAEASQMRALSGNGIKKSKGPSIGR